MMLLGWLIGGVSVVAGAFLLILSLAMIVVYPYLLLVAIPLWLGIILWVRRRFFKRRTPFTSYHLLTGHEKGSTERMSAHLVEPITIGGHNRRGTR